MAVPRRHRSGVGRTHNRGVEEPGDAGRASWRAARRFAAPCRATVAVTPHLRWPSDEPSHRAGLRFRVDWPLPFDRRRRADIAFTRAKIVVFIDGCFWHGCPEHYTAPRANALFWNTKILSNVSRDQESSERMVAEGWVVLRFWEHEDPEVVAAKVRAVYRKTLHKWGLEIDSARIRITDSSIVTYRVREWGNRPRPSSPSPGEAQWRVHAGTS